MNVVFVCTGNTCRSPMAEALLKHYGGNQLNVQSAGLFASSGADIHPNAAKVLKSHNVKVDHQSQQLDQNLFDWSDLILTMTEGHKAQILQQFAEGVDKVHTLKEYVNEDTESDGTWEQLQKAIADVESKRAAFLQELKNESLSEEDRQKREQAMHDELTVDLNKIHNLERQLPSRDIQDPFGASEEIYESVFGEIDDYIQRLLRKIV